MVAERVLVLLEDLELACLQLILDELVKLAHVREAEEAPWAEEVLQLLAKAVAVVSWAVVVLWVGAVVALLVKVRPLLKQAMVVVEQQQA